MNAFSSLGDISALTSSQNSAQSVTVSAPLATLNSAVGQVEYTPQTDWNTETVGNGRDTVTVSVTDSGLPNGTDPKTATQTLLIEVGT